MQTLPRKSKVRQEGRVGSAEKSGPGRANDILKAGTGYVGVIGGIVLGAGTAGTDHVVAGMGLGAVCVVAGITAFFADRSDR
jgi:hypothetical protein